MKAKLHKLISYLKWEQRTSIQDHEILKICDPLQAESKFGQYTLSWRVLDQINHIFKEELADELNDT